MPSTSNQAGQGGREGGGRSPPSAPPVSHTLPVLALHLTGSREEGWRGEGMSSGCREVTTTCSGARADQQLIRRHSPP